VYLEKYRVLPMTQATPDFLKDVKIARTEKGSQIMFDLMLFGSERFPDGPYSHSINIPAPRPDSIVRLCSIEEPARSQAIVREIRKILSEPPVQNQFM